MSRFLRRHCLGCGALVRGRSWCARCRVPDSVIYGREHKNYREAALEALASPVPGAIAICGICGEALGTDPRKLELDHVTAVADGGAHGARRLVHAKCNSSEGGKRGTTYRDKANRHDYGA